MSLSNKELLDKTLFLKDSVLFISKNGKEYEVDRACYTKGVSRDGESTWVNVYPVKGSAVGISPKETFEWLGDVELIEIPDGGRDMSGPPYSIVDFKTVARLLPKEKKIYNPALSGYKPESDYKQFEPWSKEQFNSPQNQNRDNAIVGFLKTGLDKIDELGVNLSNDDKAKLLNRRIENLSKQVESSEPQEKGRNEFEKYPALAEHLERMAATGQTGNFYDWNNFLQELNKTLKSLA